MFDKDDYWFNRNATDIKSNPTPKRGQGEYPELSKVLYESIVFNPKFKRWISTGPARMGIKEFKRKHSTSFTGRLNPKKKSIRGDVLRQLKEESWIELVSRLK